VATVPYLDECADSRRRRPRWNRARQLRVAPPAPARCIPDSTASPGGGSEAAAEARRRGVGFPVLTLPEAVKTIHKVSRYGPEHSQGAFAQYLGHGTSNSGPFRAKLAAFRDWKLVTASGNRVVLTELGRQLARASGTQEELPLLRSAFLRFGLFASLYEESAKGVELEVDRLKHKAVLDLGVASASADAFVRSLIESAAAAGLADSIEDGKRVIFRAVEERPEVATAPGYPEAQPGKPGGAEGDRNAVAVVTQTWPTTMGQVLLEVRSSRPLPSTAYVQVADAVAAVEKLAKVLGHVESEDDAQA
jgi:hypothetical protein